MKRNAWKYGEKRRGEDSDIALSKISEKGESNVNKRDVGELDRREMLESWTGESFLFVFLFEVSLA